MGFFDIRKKNKPSAKETEGRKKKICAVIEAMRIEDEILYVDGHIPVSRTAKHAAMNYIIGNRAFPVTLRRELASAGDEDLLQIPFCAAIPFPEEVEKVVFRVSEDDNADWGVELSFEDKQDARVTEGDYCAWASKPDIICEPNIGDHRQAVAVHKLRRLIMEENERLAMLRIPADRSRAFAMLEENADRLLVYLDKEKEREEEISDEVRLGIISYLNAALKKALDFGKEYRWDHTDYSSRWDKVRQLLNYVDDEMILNLKKTSRFVKIFFMELKYPEGCHYIPEGTDLRVMYGEHDLYELSDFDTLVFFVRAGKENLVIEGAFHLPVCVDFDELQPVALLDDTELISEVIENMEDRCRFDKIYLKELGFRLSSPKPASQTVIRLGYKINDQLVIAQKLRYDPLLCPVSDETIFGYMYENGMMVSAAAQMLFCRPCPQTDMIEAREKLLRREALGDSTESRAAVYESLVIRDFYRLYQFGYDESVYQHMLECLNALETVQADVRQLIEQYASRDAKCRSHKVWLIMDRPDRADDNGEAFFRYLMQEKPENTDSFFALQADAPGAGDLMDIGQVVEPMSLCHRMIHVIAQYVLSSQTAEFVMNPFGDQQKYVRDLCRKPELIFMQHGVTYNHFGRLISRYGRDYRGIVTNGPDEYDYFMSDRFHYTENEIWLTGFPRFDRLYDDNKKVITIMPTWRRWLTYRGFDPEINMVSWILKDDFANSAYFRFYEDLLNDRRLLEAADRYGYQIAMLPHVMFMKEGNRFKHPEKVTVYEYEVPYRKVFAESALVVTDYTSAVFDFAYLHKPVVYCQFDKEEFYTRHSVKKGYFDFERDGFGEVTDNKEACIDVIIAYMKNGCHLKDEYRERIDRFFTYNDKCCCERLLNKLTEAGKTHAV